MTGYYDDNLSARRLMRAYEIAPSRVQQYLRAEIEHVLSLLQPSDTVLELGCGYGRALTFLAEQARIVCGIDTSFSSLHLATQMPGTSRRVHLARMNAIALGYRDNVFDSVICIQNGISAFHVDRRTLMRESIRVTKPGGKVLFSSYSPQFWEHRMHWFELQSREGLVGEIDQDKTGNGVIVCKDGFSGYTVGDQEFRSLCSDLGVGAAICEVDDSSLFCIIEPL